MESRKKFQIIQLDGEELLRYQECVLDMMKDFVAVCETEGIEYSLSGGSILGAVRHRGFIPWDDDIDINIPRASYNKLLKIFDSRLGNKYYIQTPQKFPELGLMITQIRKKGTVARRKYDWDVNPCGVSIDLYVLENVFDNPVLRFFQKSMSMVCSFAISACRYNNNNNKIPYELIKREGRVLKYSTSKKFFGNFFSIIPIKKLISWCEFWNSCCKNSNTKFVAIPTGRKHFWGEIYERKEMCFFRKAQFETEHFNIPIHAEKYLSRFYGSYMQIPPADKRERHLFLELKF